MQVRLFPDQQKAIFDKEEQEKISQEKNKYNSNINYIKSKAPSVPPSTDKTVDFIMGGIVGLAVGLFICTSDAIESVGTAFLTWIICGIIGGCIASCIKGAKISESQEKINASKKEQEKESKKINAKIDEINYTYQKKYEDYIKAFDLAVQQKSVLYADSPLAKEVINWLTDGFSKTIDAADRRPHIKHISVPYVFKVYNNSITCNQGTYDFGIKRCSNLDSPVEQAALARAIASAIQFNIVLKYPTDPSGTKISINLYYENCAPSAVATITYNAINGNYTPTNKW